MPKQMPFCFQNAVKTLAREQYVSRATVSGQPRLDPGGGAGSPTPVQAAAEVRVTRALLTAVPAQPLTLLGKWGH